jgi:putative spermidine/putrescine transport system substrate-binding protein
MEKTVRSSVVHIPDGPLTRRQLLGRGALLGLSLTAAPSLLGACGGDGENTITFTSFGGAYQDAQTTAWIEPFMEKSPEITVVQDSPTDYAKLKAMVESGNVTWNVVDVANDFGFERDADLLEEIDCSIVRACDATISSKAVQNTKWRVADAIYGVVLAYRTDRFDTAPEGWADFFDPEAFPGNRGFWKFASGGVFEIALIADGVSQGQLYPLDLDRAFATLDTIKDEIVWWETGAQSAQLLADAEVTVGVSWNGRIFDVQQGGAPVEIQWNQHIQTADYLVVPKGSSNVEASMRLIDYITSREHNADLSHEISYSPPTEGAVEKVNPEFEEQLPTSYTDLAFSFDDAWWSENFDAVDRRFQAWLRG